MKTIDRSVSAKDLREQLSDVLSGVAYASERIGVTRHGNLTAVVISAEDFEALEALEAQRDAAEFAAAKAADDGGRVSLDELSAEVA